MAHRILVVDDTPDCAEPLARLLRLCGFEAGVAGNGLEALRLLDGFAPHVVILDLNMPVMDGYSFLEAIGAMPAWAQVRVIVFTSDYDADQSRLQQLGVVKVCRKACTTSFRTLVDEVRRCVECA